MNIRNIFISFVFVAMFAAAAAAQTKSFAIQSAASYVTYDAAAGTIPLGGNAFASLYPINGNFDTINGQAYNCNPAAPEFQGRCGGVRVFVVSEFIYNGDFFSAYAPVSYASPTQINFVMPYLPISFGQYQIQIGNDAGLERLRTGIGLEDASLQPFVEYQTINGVTRPMLRGSLYGYTVSGGTITGSVFLKSLTDGAPNPRTYNGLPTIIQAYYSGGQSVGGSVYTLYNGSFFGVLPIVDNSFPGVSLINIEINGIGTWDPGVQSLRLNYISQSVKTEAFVYFAN